MKKLIYLASVLMIFALTSCNSDLGPEYTTLPVVSNLSLTPHIAKVNDADTEEIATVYAGQSVTLTCTFSNTYGWSQLYLSYRTLTPEEYEDKSESEIEKLWFDKFSSDDKTYKDMGTVKYFEGPVSNQSFSATIPAQAAGIRVRWDFGYYNQYGLGAGYLLSGRLPQLEYEVKDGAASGPSSPNVPEEEEDIE